MCDTFLPQVTTVRHFETLQLGLDQWSFMLVKRLRYVKKSMVIRSNAFISLDLLKLLVGEVLYLTFFMHSGECYGIDKIGLG